MKEKERRQLFGEAVCGFVNAQTTEEACFRILASIQKILDSNPSFLEELKKVFPTMRNITPPPKNLQEEWDEISSLENMVLSGLREKLGPPFELTCNRHDQSFVLSVPQSKIEDFLELHYSKQELLLRALRKPGADLFLKSDLTRFYPTTELDVEYTHETHKAKVSVFDPHPEHKSAMHDMIDLQLNLQESWTRFNTIVLHERIQAQQETVRKILDALIHGKPITKDYSLADPKPGYALSQYLKIYNKMPKYIIEIGQQDSLDKLYPIREKDYFSIHLPLEWLDRIENDLAYCLIEFLMPEGNRKCIKKCVVCEDFIIVKDVRRQACYPPKDCEKIRRRRWSRETMRKKRDPYSPEFDPKYVS